MLFPGRCSEVNHELWTCGLFSKFSGTYRLKAAFGHFKLVYEFLVQISWYCEPQHANSTAGQAQHFVNFVAAATLCEPRSADCVAGAAFCEPGRAYSVAICESLMWVLSYVLTHTRYFILCALTCACVLTRAPFCGLSGVCSHTCTLIMCSHICALPCVCVCPTLDKGSSTTTLSTLHEQGDQASRC